MIFAKSNGEIFDVFYNYDEKIDFFGQIKKYFSNKDINMVFSTEKYFQHLMKDLFQNLSF